MMRKIWNIIRASDWWSYKLPPILAIAYATIISSSTSIYEAAPQLLVIMLSVFVGAIYVSIINDITDISEDQASGKSNRMASMPAKLRWLLPIGCLLLGLGFQFFYYPDNLSMVLYTLPWISFTLYSCKPFRFKKRGILGVLADASGSHLFISLLMISSLSYFSRIPINWTWFMSVAIWSFAYGLRGILYHQFLDRENDIEAKVNTYAAQISPESFKLPQLIISVVELLAFTVMLVLINEVLVYLFLAIYLLVIYARKRFLGYQVISIITEKNRPFQILMADFYQFFFPISLLIIGSIYNPISLIVLAVHLALFPHRILEYFQEMKMILHRKRRSHTGS